MRFQLKKIYLWPKAYTYGLLLMALTTPPLRKKLYSSMLSFPAASSILEHIWKENSSLWRSNSPRQVNLNKRNKEQSNQLSISERRGEGGKKDNALCESLGCFSFLSILAPFLKKKMPLMISLAVGKVAVD